MKLALYILIGAYLLALVNWKTVHLTRWERPELKDWMHAHEQQYALVSNVFRYGICPPCAALEPIFYHAILAVEAGKEEQEAVLHAPLPDLYGFYHLADRNTSWTFVSWAAWFLYWLPLSAIWFVLMRRVWR